MDKVFFFFQTKKKKTKKLYNCIVLGRRKGVDGDEEGRRGEKGEIR